MKRPPILAAIVVAAASVALLAGCEGGIGDFFARAVGAPTSADYDAATSKLDEAAGSIEILEQQNAEAAAALAEARDLEARAQAARGALTAQLGEIGARLPNADPDTAAALLESMDAIRSRLTTAQDQASQAAALVAAQQRRAAEISGAIDRNARALEAARGRLDGLDQATTDAIARASGAVRSAGDAAGRLGVPGAGLVGDVGGGLLETVLPIVLGVGAHAWGKRSGQRQGQESEARVRAAADSSYDEATARAMALLANPEAIMRALHTAAAPAAGSGNGGAQ